MPSYDPFADEPITQRDLNRRSRLGITPGFDFTETDDFGGFKFAQVFSTAEGRYGDIADSVVDEYSKLKGYDKSDVELYLFADPFTAGRDIENMKKALADTQQISAHNEANPDNPVKSLADIERDQITRFNASLEIEAQQSANRDVLDSVQYFLSQGLGYLSTPINSISALVGGGIGFQGTKGVLATGAKVAATEGATEAGLAAINKPGEVELREDAGQEVTAAQIAGEVAVEVLAASGLGFLIGAGGRALSNAFGFKSSAPSNFTQAPHEPTQAILNESAKAAEEIVGLSNAEHAANWKAATDQIEAGEAIDVPFEKSANEMDRPVLQELPESPAPPDRVDSETIDPDLVYTEILEDGTERTVNIKQELNELESKQDLLNKLLSCVMSK